MQLAPAAHAPTHPPKGDPNTHPTPPHPILPSAPTAAPLTGFHGIELALLLLSEFVADGRTYVSKQRRAEQVADDIAAQVSAARKAQHLPAEGA